MKKIKLILTKKVLLPFSTYELSSKEQRYFAKSIQDGEVELNGGTYLGAIYSPDGIYPSYGCMAFLDFSIAKDKHRFSPGRELTGVSSIKISNSSQVESDSFGYEQIKYSNQTIMKGVPDEKLRQKLLDLTGFDRGDIINKFVDPAAALNNLSFILVDMLFPGNSHTENLIRLNFLAETSEASRLKLLWTILFKNTGTKYPAAAAKTH